MLLVEYPCKSPEETIAMDELLLKKAESGEVGETLRFWQTEDHFIVLGRAREASKDCFLDRCARGGVKVIRRISGGGTVLQAPGCFNYSAVLSYARNEEYRNIRRCYFSILTRLAGAFNKKGHDVRFFPISDLALKEKKISGNAQARKRKYFLHHGTFLFDLDIDKVTYYIRHPSTEPEYRRRRKHSDFLTNVPVKAAELEDLIKEALSASCDKWKPSRLDSKELEWLVSEKFSQEHWNFGGRLLKVSPVSGST